MGTRHLITIIKDGEFKLAQYGQWDGYPSGQGARILEFLTNGDIETLKSNVDRLYYVTEDEADAFYQTLGMAPNQQWINMEESEKIKQTFPTLHRDTGAKIFEMLSTGNINKVDDLATGDYRIPTMDNLDFAGGWDCEWVYAVDFDKGTFEVYEAGLEENEENRFADLILEKYEGAEEAPRFVHLEAEYKLGALPSFDEFLTELDPEGLKRHYERLEWLAEQAKIEAEAAAAADTSDGAEPASDQDDGDKPIWSM